MRDYGILFSDEMVRALLRGDKSQTRRPLTLPRQDVVPDEFRIDRVDDAVTGEASGAFGAAVTQRHAYEFTASFVRSPYGRPGDRVWVREAWAVPGAVPRSDDPVRPGMRTIYRATDKAAGAWRPSIHMPRWASRLVYGVVSVRVERVQDINEDDSRAEGVTLPECAYVGRCNSNRCRRHGPDAYRRAFASLWDSIYAARGLGWDANPWVWVYDLRRIEAPDVEARVLAQVGGRR